jgi:hypothetical protein
MLMESSSRRCAVELARVAKKDLKRFQPHLTQMLRAIAVLETDPLAGMLFPEAFTACAPLGSP